MTSVVVVQIFQALAGRSQTASVLSLNPLANPALLAAAGAVIGLQALVTYLPPLQAIFGTAGLSPLQLVAPVGAGLAVLLVVEAAKLIRRRTPPT
jgi:magnesium-transporting ATPase (P-type)